MACSGSVKLTSTSSAIVCIGSPSASFMKTNCAGFGAEVDANPVAAASPDRSRSGSTSAAPAGARWRASGGGRRTSCPCLRPAGASWRARTGEDESAVGRGVEDALLHQIQFDVQNLLQFGLAERRKVTILSSRFMNSGVNLRRAASTPLCAILPSSSACCAHWSASDLACTAEKPSCGAHQGRHLGRAQVAGHEDHGAREIHLAVVAERQRGLCRECRAADSTEHRTPSRFRRTARS